jgi:hypothetical protein
MKFKLIAVAIAGLLSIGGFSAKANAQLFSGSPAQVCMATNNLEGFPGPLGETLYPNFATCVKIVNLFEKGVAEPVTLCAIFQEDGFLQGVPFGQCVAYYEQNPFFPPGMGSLRSAPLAPPFTTQLAQLVKARNAQTASRAS